MSGSGHQREPSSVEEPGDHRTSDDGNNGNNDNNGNNTAQRSAAERLRGRLTLAPMVPRDTEEPHRTSTPLELLFDLCFVVAVS
jgi:hypothetical protein